MYKYLTLLLILCFYQVRSQSDYIQQNTELNIQTKFRQYGGLFETSSRNSPMTAQFNKGQKCLVKSYLGNNKFKIEYKRWVGYVTSDYLVLNDELEDVIKNYKENKYYNGDYVNKGIVEETKISIDNRAKADEEKSRREADEAKAKADEKERIRVAAEAKAKADEEERIRVATEAKAKADEEERIRVATEAKAKADEEERIRVAAEAKAKADEKERIRIATEAKTKADEVERIRVAAEAKAKADEEERIRVAAEAKVKADEEERIRMATEVKAKADEEERIRVAAEAKAKADEEERIRVALEANAIAVQLEKKQTVDKIDKQSNKIDQPDFIKKNAELNIQTKFNQYGGLYETLSRNSPEKAQFNKGQKCVVKSYLGNNKFKIEYKKWVGYVTSEYLVINEELEEAVKKYEEYSAIEIEKEDADLNQKELNIVETQKKNEDVELLDMELQHEINVEKVQTDDKIDQELRDIERKELRFTCTYQMNEIDTFYNEKIIKTENYKVNDHLNIELYRIGNKKHVFINFDSKLGCASYFTHNRSYAKIKLENNTVVTIYHSWNVDCANFSLKGILTNSSISKLKASPIKSIKLQGTKDFVEIENVKYKEFFMDKLGCLD